MRPHVSHQPNVPGQGITASYSRRFWGLAVAIGVIAGLAGALLTLLLRAVEHISWSYHSGTFLAAVTHASAPHRVLALLAAGVVATAGVLVIGRMRESGAGEVSDGLWLHAGRLAFWPSQARALVSVVIVGMGAALGREAAPQLMSAAAASRLSEWAKLPPWQRRLLVAAGSGAGMAAVYNVPLGGALFAVEVLLGTLTLPVVAPAAAVAAIATAVAWIVVPNHAVYHLPAITVTGSLVVGAALIGPLAGALSVGWVHMVVHINQLRPRRWGRFTAPIVVLGVLGAAAIAYPQLLGNGLDVVQRTFDDRFGVGLIALLLVLRAVATAACLGSGAPGGLFTPTLALGVLLGALVGNGWSALWPGSSVAAFAVVGGAAVLAGSMQGPLAAAVLALELTGQGGALAVPIVLAVAEATIVARLFGAPTVYSGRLSLVSRHGPLTPAAGPLEPDAPEVHVTRVLPAESGEAGARVGSGEAGAGVESGEAGVRL